MQHLEITEVVLVHCNMVNNDYQQDSRVLYTFVPNKSFGIVWFTDQKSKPLEIKDRINLTMVIKSILNAISLYKNEIFNRTKR